MGGRLDATNVFDNILLCIIISIGMEHTNFLGDNIESIAKEKAGIMKANSNVIIAPQIEEKVVDTLKGYRRNWMCENNFCRCRKMGTRRIRISLN